MRKISGILLLVVLTFLALAIYVFGDVTLVAPANNSFVNASNTSVQFQFSHQGLNNSLQDYNATCNLTLDGLQVATNTTVPNGTTSSLKSNTSFTIGQHSWNITCVNGTGGGLINRSVTRVFTFDNTAPTVTLFTPINLTNTTNPVVNLTFNFTDDLGSRGNCSLFLNSVYNTSALVDNNTRFNFTTVFSNGSFTWNVSCLDNASNEGKSAVQQFTVDQLPVVINSFTLLEPDIFVTDSSENNNVTLLVNASDQGASGVQTVTANFSELGQAGLGFLNLTFNGTGNGLWNASVRLNNTRNQSFALKTVSISARDYAGNVHSGQDTTQILLYNLSVPFGDPTGCVRFGQGTTNFSTLLNWNTINFVIAIQLNGSSTCGGMPWGNTLRTMMLLNLTSINLTSQAAASKLSQLSTAIQVQITKPGDFGDSFIFVNTSFFAELNTNATLKFFDLPFASQPKIKQENSSKVVTSITWVQGPFDATFGTFTGNLTFQVNGFSQYNLSDNETPTIAIGTPTQGLITADTTPLINVTLNGTITQISKAIFSIDGVQVANYTNVSNPARCVNQTAGSELFTCTFNASTQTDGLRNLTVTAFDFGGVSPGNNATRSISFTIDSTLPSVTLHGPTNLTNTSNPTVNLTFNLTDNFGGPYNCSLSVNGLVNQSLFASNNTVTNFTKTYNNGTFAWNVSCLDNASNVGVSNVRQFTVDTVLPNVTLLSPTSGGTVQNPTTTLDWNVTDNFDGVMICNVTLGESVVQTNVLSSNGSRIISSSQSVTNGASYTWNVSCLDDSGNVGKSSSFGFTVNIPSGGGGGGGGGGAVGAPVSYNIGNIAETAASEATIGKNDKITLTEGFTTHTIQIENIGTDSVTLKVSSLSQFITLTIGETRLVDLNRDGTNDITIKLLKILSGKATLTINSLVAKPTVPIRLAPPPAKKPTLAPVEQAQVTTPVQEQVVQPPTQPSEEAKSTEAPPAPVTQAEPKSKAGWIVVAILVAIAVAGGAAYYHLRRGREK